MTTSTIYTVAAMLGATTLGACASTSSGGHARSGCHTSAAAALVGKTAPDDATILRTAGGSIVRRIAPGDMTTKDFREERVTVTIDNGRVVAASCG